MIRLNKMKNINSLILILGLFLVTGCELDNFDEPKSEFKGRFVFLMDIRLLSAKNCYYLEL